MHISASDRIRSRCAEAKRAITDQVYGQHVPYISKAKRDYNGKRHFSANAEYEGRDFGKFNTAGKRAYMERLS